MHRTNIYLADEQCERLDRLAREAGVTRSEIVRRFIDVGLRGASVDAEADVAAIEASFGALRDEGLEPLDRSEDGRRQHLDRLWRR
jgi:hypothetical protein